MTTYGLTPTGFVVKTLTQIRADLDAAMRSAFGQSLTLGDVSVLGQIDGIMAERYAELWSLAQAVYNSQDPNTATGISLDNVCALTGTLRPQATFSTVTETLTGSAGTVNSGTVVKTNSTGLQFQTTQNGTLTTVATWVAGSYQVGNRVTKGGNVYQCFTAGSSTGGPSGTTLGSPITDNTVTWYFLGPGTAAVDVPAIATVTGPVTAVAWDLSTIVTPSSALSGVTNVLAAALGQAVASDQQLRILRETELAGEGTSTQAAIQAALLKTTGVTSATVLFNPTDATSAQGLSPHSVEAIVLGGTDAAVVTTLFAEVAAGIATNPLIGTFTAWVPSTPYSLGNLVQDVNSSAVYQCITAGTSASSGTGPSGTGASIPDGTGSLVWTYIGTSVTVQDSQGTSHQVTYLRPTTIPIYVVVNLLYNAATWPSDGVAEIQNAIAAYGVNYPVGFNVTAASLVAQCFTVPGVLDVPTLYIGTSPSPGTSTTIQIGVSQLATFLTTNITVNPTQGTP